MKKRLILCGLLVFVLTFGLTVSSFASVSCASFSTKRLSNTKGDAVASANFNGVASSCSATLHLQEKYNGSWRTATGVPVTTVIRKKTNTTIIAVSYTFTLVKGKLYRTKITFVDTRGSSTWTKVYYSNTF